MFMADINVCKNYILSRIVEDLSCARRTTKHLGTVDCKREDFGHMARQFTPSQAAMLEKEAT